MAENVHIVILGGGFGGIYAGLRLEKIASATEGMKVTLISRDNFFVFTPMLHEVSSGSIATRHITIPIRTILRCCDVQEAEIESIDLLNRRVVTVHGLRDREHCHAIEYTHLLIALGSITNFYGLENVERHAMTLKTIGDAIVLRNQVIDMLEQAEIEPPEEQAGLLTFVVAGAGFAGVELVADLNDFVHEAAEHYRHVDPERIKVFLVDPGQRILPELSEDLGEFALAKLRARGIEVRLGTRIEDASETDVTLSDGHTIRTRSFIWTAGVAPSPILGTLPCAHDQRGRILTNEFMEVPDYENVWAIGDCAAIPDLRTGKTYPPTAQHAIRQGRLAAENIAASIMGGQMRAFIYDMKGQLASLGRRSGVANLLWDQVFRLLCLVALAHDLPFQIAAARAQGSGGPGLDARSHLFQRHREIKDFLTRACPTGD
jgi:NADH dehydrogenase